MSTSAVAALKAAGAWAPDLHAFCWHLTGVRAYICPPARLMASASWSRATSGARRTMRPAGRRIRLRGAGERLPSCHKAITDPTSNDTMGVPSREHDCWSTENKLDD